MWVYPCVFALSWFFALWAERSFRAGKLTAAGVTICLAVGVPAAMAGLRDVSVGTDTSGYVLDIFYATITSTGGFVQVSRDFGGKYEPGYLFIAQAGNLLPDVHIFLFLVSALTLSVVMAALVLHDRERMAFPYLIYLFFNYCESLNMSRQSVALAFGLLGAVALITKRRWLFAGSLVGAFLFHYSAILMLLFLPLYWVTEWRTNSADGSRPTSFIRGLAILGAVASSIVVVLNFRELAPVFLRFGDLRAKYGIYLEGDTTGVPPLLFLGYGFIVLVIFVRRNHCDGGRFIALSVFYGATLFLLTGVSEYLWRVSRYFLSLVVLGSSSLLSRRSNTASGDELGLSIVRSAFLLCVAGLWYVQIVVWGNHDAFPYTSSFLGME